MAGSAAAIRNMGQVKPGADPALRGAEAMGWNEGRKGGVDSVLHRFRICPYR